MNKINDKSKKILIDYFAKNPSATYVQFKKDYPGAIISDAYYYMLRRKTTGSTQGRATRKSPLYLTVWSHTLQPTGTQIECEMQKASITLLQDFITKMNDNQKTKWELIELKSPSVLEVRQLSN